MTWQSQTAEWARSSEIRVALVGTVVSLEGEGVKRLLLRSAPGEELPGAQRTD
jgi:hypothetical protein